MHEEQEFSKIIKILSRRKWWLILPFFCIIILCLIIALVLPNLFMSSAIILIENQSIPQSVVSSPVTSYAEERIQTIAQEIMSRSRILDLTRKYDLLHEKREHITTDTLIKKIRDRIIIEPINAEIHNQTQNRPFYLTIAFSLSFQDEDPRKAQSVTNEISSYFLEKNLESREKHIQSTTNFLDGQLDETKERLNTLQNEIARFRERHLEEMPELMTLNMQKVDKLNDQQRTIDMEIRSLEKQKVTLKNRLALTDPLGSNRILSPEDRLLQLEFERAGLLSRYSEEHPLVVEKNREIAIFRKKAQPSTMLEEKQGKVDALEANLAELKSRYSPLHPLVKGAEREIEILKQDLGQGEERSAHGGDKNATNPAYISLQSELERIEVTITSLEAERENLEKSIEDIYKKLRSMPTVAKRFDELNMEYQSTKDHYYEIMDKLMKAKVSQGMEEDRLGERFTVVEPAFLPDKPYKPNRIMIIMLGLFFGCGLAVGMTAVREYTDDNIVDETILERITSMPVLASISSMFTSDETRQRQKRKVLFISVAIFLLAVALFAFHLYVMDLYVLYSRFVSLLKSGFVI